MATRSLIGFQRNEEITNIIYCHWDGYPSHVGELLMNNYNTPVTVDALMGLGDLSSLNATLETCDAYHRDKKESRELTESRDVLNSEIKQVANDYGVDYVYIFNNNFEWDCLKPNGTHIAIVADVA